MILLRLSPHPQRKIFNNYPLEQPDIEELEEKTQRSEQDEQNS
ncbi:19004_t:CDS:2 [Gigaspora margarita]|uniref:19004_t:CDS:1 n=1 Tax=Gigaspora margarita TaxID=4874 RepID=A0ABN7UKG0_GIGMA|nr:19004_t:CDS:2 [Gigaspora margarita]